VEITFRHRMLASVRQPKAALEADVASIAIDKNDQGFQTPATNAVRH
jgi:hypothetical protein